MKTKSNLTAYIIHSIAATALLLSAQISLASNATWLSSPQDSAWENANNWTPGGPPNGPSDIATFDQSSQTGVNISTPKEVNSIVFTSGSAAYDFSIMAGELIISGMGLINNNSVLQTFTANGGQIIFNNTSTAASVHMYIYNLGVDPFGGGEGYTIFNDRSNAAGASIFNSADAGLLGCCGPGATIFNDTSTAGHATITNGGPGFYSGHGGYTTFNDSSTADSATLVANVGFLTLEAVRLIFMVPRVLAAQPLSLMELLTSVGGAIRFHDSSTGGTARVEVFDNGDLIRDHQSGVTIGSIEGSGNVFLGANNLTVGANNVDTSFSGMISCEGGSLAKIGSGVLTLQTNHCLADTVGLILVTGSIIKLDFTGAPDVIASLKVNGVPQPPGIYGGPMSGAPNILPEFAGSGTVEAGPISTLGNISTRAFVQTGNNVMIGGFIIEGTGPKMVILRAIGPELAAPPFNIPNALANPRLELHNGTGALIASNDNWQTTVIAGIITASQVSAIQNSGHAPTQPSESAIIATLQPGNYTAIVRGVNNTIGVALVEVYDISPNATSILGNISTRGFVQIGNNVMIGGFIVQGTGQKTVIVRAIGPELSAPPFNIPNALANPTLELHNGNGALIARNDNWQTTIIGGIITASQVSAIQNSGHAPTQPSESAIIATLSPGNYTAIVRGVNNTTGVALVEMYDLQ